MRTVPVGKLYGSIETVSHDDHRRIDTAVTVVVPALNEGPHIGDQIRALARVLEECGWDHEIVVVDDGSSDETAEQAVRAGARVFRHSRNRGYGASLKEGIRRARYDWILICDADGTYPAEAVPALLAAADDEEMIVGARVGAVNATPLLRRPAKWFLGRLASFLAGQNLPDLNSGLRLMRRDLVQRYEHLLPSGFSFTTTITLASTCNDHRVRYVPIDYLPRLGRSSIRPRHAFDFLILILRTIVLFNPLRVFLPLGALVATVGGLKLGYDLLRQDVSESAIFALLVAVIVWSVGLLADQNARLGMRR